MRTGLGLASLGAAAVLALAQAAAAPGPALAAVDNEQYCRAMQEIARLGKSEIGRWIDRHTRDDGVEVLCPIRTVNYKRFVQMGSGAKAADWKARRQQEWNSTACSSTVLREGIDSGWIITQAITTSANERLLLIATCK